MKLRIGDKVSVLDEDISGVIVNIMGFDICIETEDGFQFEFPKNQLIRIEDLERVSSQGLFIDFEDKDQSEKKKKQAPVKSMKRQATPVFEVDLHIHQLLPNSKGMSKHDILTHQLDTARSQLEFAIRKRIPRMVFIHGVGEGILKVELDYLLGRYDNISSQEANYQKYGLGATEVLIHQNAKRR